MLRAIKFALASIRLEAILRRQEGILSFWNLQVRRSIKSGPKGPTALVAEICREDGEALASLEVDVSLLPMFVVRGQIPEADCLWSVYVGPSCVEAAASMYTVLEMADKHARPFMARIP